MAATFVYSAWAATFPELTAIPQMQVDAYAVIAQAYLPSDDIVSDPAVQAILLNFATAHLASLFRTTTSGTGTVELASPLVGRISSATEGSVSVAVTLDASGSPSAAFWQQTSYGLAYWSLLGPYRSMRYIPSPRAACGPGGPFGGYGLPYGRVL